MLAARLAAVLFLIGLARWVSVPTSAAPPAGQPVDPEMHRWFDSLKQPKTGAACCSIADCRPYESRMVGDHYELLDHGRWRPVPGDVILHRENKVGTAIACLETQWNYSFGPPQADFLPAILCFIPGPEV
jgi:hypothetical protein